MKRFRRITMGKPLIMGEDLSASGRKLPGRETVVVTAIGASASKASMLRTRSKKRW